MSCQKVVNTNIHYLLCMMLQKKIVCTVFLLTTLYHNTMFDKGKSFLMSSTDLCVLLVLMQSW